jgi:hypothetical protein
LGLQERRELGEGGVNDVTGDVLHGLLIGGLNSRAAMVVEVKDLMQALSFKGTSRHTDGGQEAQSRKKRKPFRSVPLSFNSGISSIELRIDRGKGF